MIRGVFIFLFLAASIAARAASPIVLPEAQGIREGQELARTIVSLRPAEDAVSTGVLKRRVPRKPETSIPVRVEIRITPTNWMSVYESPDLEKLVILHPNSGTNEYRRIDSNGERSFSGAESFVPFADTDFWAADLGLEFLHWPKQRILRKEIHRGQSCSVLESTNPDPKGSDYARVLSWVDIDTSGIITAEAYDAKGRRVKQFSARKFKKVQGQWELKEIEMLDLRKDSRTALVFDLGATQPR